MSTLFTYQFCAFTQLASPKTFAYMDETFLGVDGVSSETTQTILTDDSYSPYRVQLLLENGANEANGISIAH